MTENHLFSHLIKTQTIGLVQTKYRNFTELVLITSQVVPVQSRTRGKSYPVFNFKVGPCLGGA